MAEQVTYMLLIQDSTGQVYKHLDNVEIPTGFSMMMVADDGRIYRNPTVFVANSVAEALDKKGISYEYESTTKTRMGGKNAISETGADEEDKRDYLGIRITDGLAKENNEQK